jgi:hypothetical protein
MQEAKFHARADLAVFKRDELAEFSDADGAIDRRAGSCFYGEALLRRRRWLLCLRRRRQRPRPGNSSRSGPLYGTPFFRRYPERRLANFFDPIGRRNGPNHRRFRFRGFA